MLEIFQKFAKLSKRFVKRLDSKKENLAYVRLKNIFLLFVAFSFAIFHSSQNLERDGVLPFGST